MASLKDQGDKPILMEVSTKGNSRRARSTGMEYINGRTGHATKAISSMD